MSGRKSRTAGHISDLGDGRWLVRTSHGRNWQGKRIRARTIVRGTKKDAQRHLTSVLKRQDDGFSPVTGRQTFGEWVTEWLTDWTANLGPRTRADAESQFRRLFQFDPMLAGRRLAGLTAAEVQSLVNRLQQKGFSPRTIRMYHGAVRACLSRAERLGKVARNVALLAELPAQVRTERAFLTPANAERFLVAADGLGDQYGALFALLLLTGIRPGEACGLQWADWEGSQLRIRRSLVWFADRAPILAETKTRRSRVIALSERALRVLQQHRVRQVALRLRMGASYGDRGLVFATELGRPLHLRNISARHFKRLLQGAGLPNLRLYDLRHTHATLLLAAGEHPKVVQERLGHSTITLTLDTYSHVVPGMQERAAERLDAILEDARRTNVASLASAT